MNIFSQGKKLSLMALTSILLTASLIATPVASAISIGGPSDCDNNAVIKCGAHSTAALVNAYQSDPYVQKVYANFGISNADITNLNGTNVAGRVTKDGNVFVDGQSRAVAHDAITGGRQNMPGSKQVNGLAFYQRPPSASFQQQSLPAFVSMKNGQFQFAVIASCGNPVKATPARPPTTAVAPAKPVSRAAAKPAPQPAPAPAPAQTQMQAQSQTQNVNVRNTNTMNVQNTPQPQPAPQAAPAATPAEQPAAAQSADTQPSKLVNTGPAGLVGVFLAASAAGAFGFRRFLTRRLGAGKWQ